MNFNLLVIFLALTAVMIFSILVLNNKYDIKLELSGYSAYKSKKSLSGSKWIVLAGDSNMRHVWILIKDTLSVLYKSKISKTLTSKVLKVLHEDDRWVDRDTIFYFKNDTKLRISFKFLHGGVSEFDRISNTWSDIRMCHNASCDQRKVPSVQHEEFHYATTPDILWLTHGLWGIRRPMVANYTMNCKVTSKTSEYVYYASKYLAFVKNDVKVIWQTNPSIVSHPWIKPAYVKSDYLCQKKLSAENNITLFDIYQLTQKKRSRMAGGYHYDVMTQHYIIENILWNVLV